MDSDKVVLEVPYMYWNHRVNWFSNIAACNSISASACLIAALWWIPMHSVYIVFTVYWNHRVNWFSNIAACNSISASALWWIPMHSVYIVIPGPGVPGFPGHGLVAWYLGPDMCYWETTRTWSSKYQREKYSSEEYWKGGGMLHEILETDSRGSTNDP